MQRTYEFTLRFAIPAGAGSADEWINKLAKAGFEDALIAIGIPGRIVLDFERASSDADSALRDAVADVQREIPEARLIEAGPDYVDLTEIEELLDIPPGAMRKVLDENIDQFPLPEHEGNPSIWHLKDVLEWMGKEQGRVIDTATEEMSKACYRMNSSLRPVAS